MKLLDVLLRVWDLLKYVLNELSQQSLVKKMFKKPFRYATGSAIYVMISQSQRTYVIQFKFKFTSMILYRIGVTCRANREQMERSELNVCFNQRQTEK